MLRLRAYEKLQGLVSQGAVRREVTGGTKKYKGVATRMVVLRAEMKALRAACNERAPRAKAAAAGTHFAQQHTTHRGELSGRSPGIPCAAD